MTIKQIISLLCGDVISYDEGGWSCKFDKEAIEIITTALEKLEKYKWHDLRKNPNDLPVKDGNFSVRVIASFLGGLNYEAIYCYEDGCMFNGHIGGKSFIEDKVKKGEWISHNVRVEPIAWKYIEPFEDKA